MENRYGQATARTQGAVRQFITETRKPDLAPWPFVVGGIIIGAALFGAGAAFIKLAGA